MSDIYHAYFKGDTKPAVIAGQWERDRYGNIKAWYTAEQLQMCLDITRPPTIKEFMQRADGRKGE